MTDARSCLLEGEPILTEKGMVIVVHVEHLGVELLNVFKEVEFREYATLDIVRSVSDGCPVALSEPLRPMWDALDEDVKQVALNRLEVVQEVLTGYRDGHPALARKGEPHIPYGPGFGLSESKRCTAMAQQLALEAAGDRRLQRRVYDGEIQPKGCSPTTVRSWVRAFKARGLVALIDGRSIRPSKSWELVDERYRSVATEIIDTFDGDRSDLAIQEIHRRTMVQLKVQGIDDVRNPQKKTQEFLSALKREKGSSTRAQRSHKTREVSGIKHYPAIRPGQVVAIDVTRADNLVFDPLSGESYSVEIIDVATRVVLALRVVPKSANGVEAGLLTYDVCRPFSVVVEGTTVSDWRWGGLPEKIDLTEVPVRYGRRLVSPDFSTLQGEHRIPSVRPTAIHTDHASIFVSRQYRDVLASLGIDLLLNRGGKSNDNPHVERWHETIQRGLQQIPGYKGRNVSERGRLVSKEPLLTARQLQLHLRKWIALDYHRTPHTGIVLPDEFDADLCPLEFWDSMVELTGRIDVPQSPSLIYQFLPIRWGTIGHAGVEFKDLVYDSVVLDPYRSALCGRFRARDNAAPFFVDPQDLSRIWFFDRESGRVEPIEWRGADRTRAPMAEAIVNTARKRILDRGGNRVIDRNSATRQILDELTQITEAPDRPTLRKMLIAARTRVEQDRIDHGEAQAAQQLLKPAPAAEPRVPTRRGRWPNLLDEGA